MTDLYAPNQQTVRADGSGPAEEGTGGDAGDVGGGPVYDPGDHTVEEVQAYVTEHPDQTAAVTAAEQAGKNRVTLLEWLGA